MVRVLSVLVLGGLGTVMILTRNVKPYYARPVQSSPSRRVAVGVLLLLFAVALAGGAISRLG